MALEPWAVAMVVVVIVVVAVSIPTCSAGTIVHRRLEPAWHPPETPIEPSSGSGRLTSCTDVANAILDVWGSKHTCFFLF